MDAYRIHVKLDAELADGFNAESLIPVFHRWIQADALDDEVLIDVADYRHVPTGPGVMLIAHHANYALDFDGGRPGVLYARKRPPEEPAPFADRLRDALRRAVVAAQALGVEPALRGGVRVTGGAFTLRLVDRLAAPNTESTYAAIEPILRGLAADLFDGAGLRIERETNPRAPFALRVEAARAPGVEALLERLENAAVLVS